MRVEVLLATCNSERFLEPMLESLATQTFRDFVLVISDDCSTDGTVAIIRRWADRFDNAPELVVREVPSGSAGANFASLLALSRGDYVFLADHDDIWLPEKIFEGLVRMHALEERVGSDVPLLVHGDLTVVDADDTVIAPSFWAFKSIFPTFGMSLNTALMHPTVTGCTAVLNRPLVERVRDIPRAAVMHDWWIDLAACAFGAVDFDPVPHIRYRIHGANVSVPKRSSLGGALRRLPAPSEVRRWVRLRLDQGAEFLSAYADELPPDALATLEQFVSIRSAGPIARRRRLRAGGFRSPDTWRNAAAMLFV